MSVEQSIQEPQSRRPGQITGIRAAAAGFLELACWSLLGGLIVIGNLGRITDSVPLGRERESTVPVFNTWTIGWNAKLYQQGPGDYWNAPIFFPLNGTFTFSEAQPTMLLVAPLANLTKSCALAYNIYLMLLLGLNPWVTRRLLMQQGIPPASTWCAGFMMLLLPFIHQQAGVVQLVSICGPLSILWRVLCWVDSPDWKNATWLGLSFSLTYAACNYYGLFISLLAPVFLILLWPRLCVWRNWLKFITAAAVALVLILPIVLAQLTFLQGEVEPRSLELIKGLSAAPRGYLAPYWTRWKGLEFSALVDVKGVYSVGTGSILTLVGIAGGITGLINRQRRRWTLFLLVLIFVAGLLSCGPNARWGTMNVYEWLRTWYPGLRLIRSPFRFAVIVQTAQVLLAADSLRFLEHWLSRRRRTAIVALLIATSVMTAQTWPLAPRLHQLPDAVQNRGWINWLKKNCPPDKGIVCLPFPTERTSAGYEQTVDWMYLGLWHERAMLNGYSGFFPPHFLQAKTFMKSFPDAPSVTLLRQWGIRFAVVRKADAAAMVQSVRQLKLVYEDQETSVQIYSLETDE